MFNLKRMLGLLAIGGAVYYARSRKIDVLGKLGLRRGASPEPSASRDDSTSAGLSHDRRPDNAVPGVGAPRTPASTGSNYSGFGSKGDFGTNRPR